MSKIYPVGRVYAIRSPNIEKIYIGSTSNLLYKRINYHRRDYKKFLEGKRNMVTSAIILEAGGAYIELLEQYENVTKEQLLQYEGEHIRKNNNCVNKKIAGRTKKEYFEDNIEILREKKRQYAKDHKEEIKKKGEIYRNNNNEEIKKRKKIYYEKNKEKFLEKMECECGGRYDHMTKKRHLRSKKHTNYLKK